MKTITMLKTKARRAPIAEMQNNPAPSQEDIALAAYYRAERRGFAPGCELNDWLEAERELCQEVMH